MREDFHFLCLVSVEKWQKMQIYLSSLAPDTWGCYYYYMTLQHIPVTDMCIISYETSVIYLTQGRTGD